MNKIFIGFDDAEPVAFHTCVQSIIKNSSQPVEIVPLYLPQLKLKTPYHKEGYAPSNGFIYSRFLVPYLSDFKGISLFIDGDMVVESDITELFDYDMSGIGVRVVKHDYQTTLKTKYLNSVNEDYPRKNWSSVILFNNWFYPNKVLTPEFVGNSSGEFLHQFKWLENEWIGELSKDWNYLVSEPNQCETPPKLLHYTLGTCCFKDYRDLEHSGNWWKYYEQSIYPLSMFGESLA